MLAILFAVLTIVGAYGVTVGIALGLLFLTHATAPSWMARSGEPKPLFLFLNIVIWCVSAAMGGIMVGFLAQWHPNIVAFGLACALFAAIFSVALESIGKTSLNYEVLLAACTGLSVIGASLLMQYLHLHLHITS